MGRAALAGWLHARRRIQALLLLIPLITLFVGVPLLAASLGGQAEAAGPPVIDSILANPTYGTDTVTIEGSDFTNATGVDFGGLAGTSLDVINDGELTVVVPEGSGTVPVVVMTSTDGNSAAFSFSYIPHISGFSPVQSTAGTTMTIDGDDLGVSGTTVTIGGNSAPVTAQSATQLMVTIPASAVGGSQTLEVFAPDGDAFGPNLFRYSPILTGISPSSGPTGTSVTITGVGLSGSTDVEFGGLSATPTATSNTSVTVLAPEGIGLVSVAVQAPEGTATDPADPTFQFTPTITDVSPTSGTSGTSVTLTGTDLGGTSAVTFNGTAASPVAKTYTSVTVDAPTLADGTLATVAILNADGNVTASQTFTYSVTPPPPPPPATPTLTGITPGSGPGLTTTVTLTGTDLAAATGATFGGVAGTAFTATSDTSATVTAPQGSGSVPVVVSTPDGAASGVSFSYTPLITSVTPGSGSQGTVVTIAGSDLALTSEVNFGITPGTALVYNGDNTLTVTAPLNSGIQPITVFTPDGNVGGFSFGYIVTPPPPPPPTTPAPPTPPIGPTSAPVTSATMVNPTTPITTSTSTSPSAPSSGTSTATPPSTSTSTTSPGRSSSASNSVATRPSNSGSNSSGPVAIGIGPPTLPPGSPGEPTPTGPAPTGTGGTSSGLGGSSTPSSTPSASGSHHVLADGGSTGGLTLSSSARQLHTFGQLIHSWKNVAFAGLTVAGLILVLIFPAELFNSVLGENFDTFVERFDWVLRVRERRKHSREWPWPLRLLAAAGYLIFGGILASLLNPDWHLNEETMIRIAGCTLALGIPLTVVAFVEVRYMMIRIKERGKVRLRPATLALCGLTVLASRLFHIVPGYIFGLIAAVAYVQHISERDHAHVFLARGLARLGMGLGAWLLLGPVRGGVDEHHAGWLRVLSTETLTELTIISLTSGLLVLPPFQFFEGHSMFRTMRKRWIALYAATILAFVEIVAQPSFVVTHAKQGSFGVFLSFFLVLMIATAGVWLFFRHEHRKRMAEHVH